MGKKNNYIASTLDILFCFEFVHGDDNNIIFFSKMAGHTDPPHL
jgi:hypothetical protein